MTTPCLLPTVFNYPLHAGIDPIFQSPYSPCKRPLNQQEHEIHFQVKPSAIDSRLNQTKNPKLLLFDYLKYK